MGKYKVPVLLMLVVFASVWTIYSKFIQKDVQKNFSSENEFVQFLNQQLGYDESLELESVFYDEDSHEHAHENMEPEIQAVNVEVEDFQLNTIDHKQMKLSDFKGKKVLINFWTTWCPPCKEEMPHLNEYYKEFAKEHNVEILAINITDEEILVSDVEKFAQKNNIKFPILLDETGKVSIDFRVISIPTSFIVNEEGNIIEKVTGPVTKDILITKFGQ